MPQLWEDLLQEASFGGVRFDMVSVRDDGSNTLDEVGFPGRTGKRVEGRANDGDEISVTAVFIEDDYPDTMNKLLAKLRDPSPQRFVHPVFGEVKAAAKRWSVVHDVEDAADSATMSISFVVHTVDDGLVATPATTPARANAVRSLGEQVLEALSTFQAALEVENSEIGLAVTGAVNAADGIATEFQETVEDLSTLAIQTKANDGLAQVDEAVVLLADFETAEQYDLSSLVQQMGAALRELADGLIKARPPLSILAVAADTNLAALAHALGDDPEELLALNSIPDPAEIPAGFKITRYAED